MKVEWLMFMEMLFDNPFNVLAEIQIHFSVP